MPAVSSQHQSHGGTRTSAQQSTNLYASPQQTRIIPFRYSHEPPSPHESHAAYNHHNSFPTYQHADSLERDPFVIEREIPRKRKRFEKDTAAFPCSSCDKVFDRLADRNKHERYHSSTRHHACPECDKRFLFPKDVRRHLKSVHRVAEPVQDGAASPVITNTGNVRRVLDRPYRSDTSSPQRTDSVDDHEAVEPPDASAPDLLDPRLMESTLPTAPRPFRYRPLDPRQIRLLHINPAESEDEPVVVRISHQSLDSARYQALSYCWGAPATEHKVHIDNEYIIVRSNLHSALRRFRRSAASVTLWVDAICINQHDDKERAAQVTMMSSIYSHAAHVLVWTGEHDEDSTAALDFAKSLSIFENPKEAAEDWQNWNALALFLNRPWFSRLWVIQEIAMAKDATLYCGDTAMAWSDFETSVSLLQSIATDAIMPHGVPWNLHPSSARLIHDCAATRLTQVKAKVCRFDDSGRVSQLLYSIQDLVVMSSSWLFSCSDPRDRIYALLSLAKDAEEWHNGNYGMWPTYDQLMLDYSYSTLSLETGKHASGDSASSNNEQRHSLQASRPKTILHAAGGLIMKASELLDYRRSPQETYSQFFELSCRRLVPGNLDMLCRPWAGAGHLPSWIPSWDRASFCFTDKTNPPQLRRKNHDPLVGMVAQGQPHYSACNQSFARFGYEWEVRSDLGSLKVTGFVVDTVASTCDASQFGFVPEEWLQFGRQASEPDDTFWRVLVANRGPDGANAPRYYKQAFERALEQSVNGLETTQPKAAGHPALSEFLARVESVVWNRRLYRSQGDQRLGLCPQTTHVGDLICVLIGVSVPVILRRLTDTTYVLIGECYLHGIMDGEAMDLQKSRNIPIEQFNLV